MSRRTRSREAEDQSESPGGKRLRWLFPVVAGAIVAFWVVMSLPRAESDEGVSLPYTTKRAGWPDSFSRWSVRNDTGETTYSSFSTGALLGNLVVMAVPIIVVWIIARRLSQQPDQSTDQPAARHRKPTEEPPQRGTASGGWG